MAWSSIVRRDPSQAETPPLTSLPLPSHSVESLPSRLHPQRTVAVAVIDANALISAPTSTLFSIADRFVTVKEVLDEVRDPASRFQLAALPFSVECLQPCDEALRKVLQFARETGDLHSLSAVDLKLLALTYTLEEQRHGAAHLRSKAPPLQVLQTKHIRERDLPGWGSNVQNIEEWEELPQHAGHDGNEESHILNLKNLSLDDLNTENESKDIDGHQLHDSLNKGEIKDTYSDLQNQNSDVSKSLSMENSDVSKSLLMERKLESEECMQEDFIQDAFDEGEWQRSVSRSTRRKYDKRARRRNMLLSQSVNGVESSQELDDLTNESEHSHQGSINGGRDDLILNEAKDADVERQKVDNCSSMDVKEADLEGADEIDLETEIDKIDDCCSLTNELNCGEEASSVFGTESEESFMVQPLSYSSVACITADFAMQNVLLQIGLRVISPNGLQVHKLHRWVLKCEACRNVVSDVGRIFCPKCGNGGTLYKVSVSIGPNGVTHTGRRRRTNIRGTKYSLPLPKGGREGIKENPILREDQLTKKMLHPKKKVSNSVDLSTFCDIFEVKTVGKQTVEPPIRAALAVFSGKRNPNVVRKQRR